MSSRSHSLATEASEGYLPLAQTLGIRGPSDYRKSVSRPTTHPLDRPRTAQDDRREGDGAAQGGARAPLNARVGRGVLQDLLQGVGARRAEDAAVEVRRRARQRPHAHALHLVHHVGLHSLRDPRGDVQHHAIDAPGRLLRQAPDSLRANFRKQGRRQLPELRGEQGNVLMADGTAAMRLHLGQGGGRLEGRLHKLRAREHLCHQHVALVDVCGRGHPRKPVENLRQQERRKPRQLREGVLGGGVEGDQLRLLLRPRARGARGRGEALLEHGDRGQELRRRGLLVERQLHGAQKLDNPLKVAAARFLLVQGGRHGHSESRGDAGDHARGGRPEAEEEEGLGGQPRVDEHGRLRKLRDGDGLGEDALGPGVDGGGALVGRAARAAHLLLLILEDAVAHGGDRAGSVVLAQLAVILLVDGEVAGARQRRAGGDDGQRGERGLMFADDGVYVGADRTIAAQGPHYLHGCSSRRTTS
mmetsp:Transcript_22375/g.59061  ORF Transcript_22375/g.59061 Transcript_22375/m.59061 type:complete len:473 (+) Transcript_22375:175-1593(+)